MSAIASVFGLQITEVMLCVIIDEASGPSLHVYSACVDSVSYSTVFIIKK